MFTVFYVKPVKTNKQMCVCFLKYEYTKIWMHQMFLKPSNFSFKTEIKDLMKSEKKEGSFLRLIVVCRVWTKITRRKISYVSISLQGHSNAEVSLKHAPPWGLGHRTANTGDHMCYSCKGKKNKRRLKPIP